MQRGPIATGNRAVPPSESEGTKKNILTRQITSFRNVGKPYGRRQEVHRLRLYKSAEPAGELRGAGFKVRIFRGYGKLRFRDAHVGFVARRPR